MSVPDLVLHLPERRSGVYHLVRDGEVIYVGQSINVFQRIASHPVRPADEARIFFCEPDELNERERADIERLRPALNRAGVTWHYISVPRAIRVWGDLYLSCAAFWAVRCCPQIGVARGGPHHAHIRRRGTGRRWISDADSAVARPSRLECIRGGPLAGVQIMTPRDLFAGPALLAGAPSDEMQSGRRIGRATVEAIGHGPSDPDFLMRRLLALMADRGFVVPPNATIRGFCEALQGAIANGSTS